MESFGNKFWCSSIEVFEETGNLDRIKKGLILFMISNVGSLHYCSKRNEGLSYPGKNKWCRRGDSNSYGAIPTRP